jgi:branched-chain amino acid transport system permease protein
VDAATFLQLAVSGLLTGGVYALMSIGLTLIFGVMRIVNFAHGEFLMAAMFSAYWMFELFGFSVALTAPLTGLVFCAYGALVYVLIVGRTVGSPMVVQIFATVGLGLVMQNAALILWGGEFRTVRSPEAEAVLKFWGVQAAKSSACAFAAAVLVSLAVMAFIRWTYPGRAVRATVQDRTAARLYGVDVDRVYFWTFAAGSGLVGLAGALIAPTYPIFPSVGQNFGLASFVVVVLGGMGSLPGALLGGLLIGLAETAAGFFIGDDLKKAVYFMLFILVLTLKPAGLFGQRGSEEIGLK